MYSVFAFYKLGAFTAPQSYYQSQETDEWFTVTFYQSVNIKEIYSFSGIGDQFYPDDDNSVKQGCNFDLMYMDESGLWQQAANLEHKYVFTWEKIDTDIVTDSIMVRAREAGQVLNELILLDENGQIIQGWPTMTQEVEQHQYNPYLALDESHLLPTDQNDYYWSMYFDEIYHGRTAYEQMNGYTPYETTHPPLGKILISIGISIFGMTPFGWRFMGTLCGVIMVAIMYFIAKRLLKTKIAAFTTTFVFAFDFMHFTQTRLGTVDSYVTMFVMLMFLFMIKYAEVPLEKDIYGQYLNLLVSGVFMGCAIAVKWNGAYSAVALALYYFRCLAIKYFTCVKNGILPKNSAFKICLKTCLWCMTAFIIVPLLVYFSSFLPVLKESGVINTFVEFFRYQKRMFSYHYNLKAEHYFASPWYSWPFMVKPIWYSVSSYDGMRSTIAAFGNIAVWPLIPFALIFTLWKGVFHKDEKCLPVLLGYVFSLIPWAFIERLTFIYHYFPASIFGILAIGYCIDKICFGANKKGKVIAFVYMATVFACFIAYFPVISGVPAKAEYINALKLLPTWYF